MVSLDGFFLIDNKGNKIYEIFPYDNGPDYVSEGLQRKSVISNKSYESLTKYKKLIILKKSTFAIKTR